MTLKDDLVKNGMFITQADVLGTATNAAKLSAQLTTAQIAALSTATPVSLTTADISTLTTAQLAVLNTHLSNIPVLSAAILAQNSTTL